MAIYENDPAFSLHIANGTTSTGLLQRDYIAIEAMKSFILEYGCSYEWMPHIASKSYKLADEMIRISHLSAHEL